MLHAAGLPLYKGLRVHGYWNRGSQKISKSLPHKIHPFEMRDQFGWEAFRYYMLREMAFGADCNFAEEGVIKRLNDDLGNDLGNLLNRSVSMLERYFDGVVPEPPAESELALVAERVRAEIDAHLANFSTQRALVSLWELVSAGNKFIDSKAPWKLAKQPECRAELGGVLYECLEGAARDRGAAPAVHARHQPRAFWRAWATHPAAPRSTMRALGRLEPGTMTRKIDAFFRGSKREALRQPRSPGRARAAQRSRRGCSTAPARPACAA